jgi:hypothetical protein
MRAMVMASTLLERDMDWSGMDACMDAGMDASSTVSSSPPFYPSEDKDSALSEEMLRTIEDESPLWHVCTETSVMY